MMELTPELLFVGVVINRLVELVKASLPIDEGERFESARTLVLLLVSFVLGALAVVLVFPAANMFPTASSPLAGQIATGIVVGGIANGIDFVAGLGENVSRGVARLADPKAA